MRGTVKNSHRVAVDRGSRALFRISMSDSRHVIIITQQQSPVRHSPSISVTLDFPCSPRAAALPHTRIATVVTSVHATRFLTTACDAARHG